MSDDDQNEENSIRDIFVNPGLSHIADMVFLNLDITSLNICQSVCRTWNVNVREFFLLLEDVALLPAMSNDYKQIHMGGWMDYVADIWNTFMYDELEEMASSLVCYHVKGFKKEETQRVVSAKIQVLPQWRKKTFKELESEKLEQEIEKVLNISLRKAVLKEMFPVSSGLHNKAENSIGRFENNLRFTISNCVQIQGHVNVNLAVTQDSGEIVIQNLWIAFLGASEKRRRGDFQTSSPFFDENVEEEVFKITYMNLSNERDCLIDFDLGFNI